MEHILFRLHMSDKQMLHEFTCMHYYMHVNENLQCKWSHSPWHVQVASLLLTLSLLRSKKTPSCLPWASVPTGVIPSLVEGLVTMVIMCNSLWTPRVPLSPLKRPRENTGCCSCTSTGEVGVGLAQSIASTDGSLSWRFTLCTNVSALETLVMDLQWLVC